MAVIIKKGRSAQPADPILPRPKPKPERNFCTPLPYYERKIAETAEELYLNPNTLRAPEQTLCSFCGHPYGFPCHGKSDKCMNARWLREQGAKS